MFYQFKLNDDCENGFIIGVEAQDMREACDKMELVIGGKIDRYDIISSTLCKICQEPINGVVQVHHHN